MSACGKGPPKRNGDLQDVCRVRFTRLVGGSNCARPSPRSYGVSKSHMGAVNVRPVCADSRNTLCPGGRDLERARPRLATPKSDMNPERIRLHTPDSGRILRQRAICGQGRGGSRRMQTCEAPCLCLGGSSPVLIMASSVLAARMRGQGRKGERGEGRVDLKPSVEKVSSTTGELARSCSSIEREIRRW